MGDNIFLGDRNGVRTPMQWSPDRNAGFSRADPQRLYLPPIMDPIYGYEAVNVEAQAREPRSLLNWTRRMLAVRKTSQAFGRGTLRFLKPGNRKILAYLRELRRRSDPVRGQPVALGAAGRAGSGALRGRVPVEMLGRTAVPADRRAALPADAARRTASTGSGWRPTCRRPGLARGARARARTCRCWCCSTAGTASSATAWCPGASAWRRRCARSSRRRCCRATSRPSAGTRPRARRSRAPRSRDHAEWKVGGEELAVHAGRRRDGRGQADLLPAARAGLGRRRRGARAQPRAGDAGAGAPAGGRGRAGRRVRRRSLLPRAGRGDRREPASCRRAHGSFASRPDPRLPRRWPATSRRALPVHARRERRAATPP